MASVRKRVLPSGKAVWQVDFRDQDGKRCSRQFKTKREATEFETKARNQVQTGVYVHAPASITVKMACDQYLAHIEARMLAKQEMEPATLRDYKSKIKLHILDSTVGIGSVKLSELTVKRVGEFRDKLLSAGRSVALTRRLIATLGFVLKLAREQGAIATMPTQGVTVRSTTRRGNKVTKDQVGRLKGDVKGLLELVDDKHRPYLIVAALVGLRASEQRGLTWSAVDFEHGYIHVRQRADAFNTIGEPKSEAGNRSIPIGPMVSNTLKAWKLRCPPSEMDLVFPNRNGGVRAQTDVLRLWFKPACRKLGIEMRWHDLRHFAVSLWIEQGFDIKAVMEFAGHSDYRMTMERYGHLFPEPDHHRRMGDIEKRLLA